LFGFCEQPGECRPTPAGIRCGSCGYTNGPVCQGPVPCPNDEPVDGWCRPCGSFGQACCRSLGGIVCRDKLMCKDGYCGGPPSGGGGGGTQLKTCSGQPRAWSAKQWTVYVEDANGCVGETYPWANTGEEAVQCVRSSGFGDDVIGLTYQEFSFAVTCPHTGCNQRTYKARDQDSAEKCAEATSLGCTVEAGACRP
jgi:hypothetical protein